VVLLGPGAPHAAATNGIAYLDGVLAGERGCQLERGQAADRDSGSEQVTGRDSGACRQPAGSGGDGGQAASRRPE
jgi:hypothetical protein